PLSLVLSFMLHTPTQSRSFATFSISASSLVSSLLFFFYCYGDHRDLHSFPTRRSSDLAPTTNRGRSARRTPPRSSKRWSARRASDRKSTRLNSSHVKISYAVFCLKKKKHGQAALAHRDGDAQIRAHVHAHGIHGVVTTG